MMHYLAIHEAPCVGTCPVAFDATNDQEAENIAWIDSCKNPNFVAGGYYLYKLVYKPFTHTHILVPVEPIEEEVQV